MVTLLALVLCGTVGAPARFSAVEYVEKPIEARVPWYSIRPDLSNISNRQQLPKLTTAQRQSLVATRFVARPTREEQMFYLYDENDYLLIPSFVTTDAVLHTYHVFYDMILRWLEKDRLLVAVRALSQKMLDANLAAARGRLPESVKQAVDRNIAYFAVALRLLGDLPDIPGRCQDLVEEELRRIAAHSQTGRTIGGGRLDYTQFIPRGHYTRDEAFRKYFQAMIWYGTVAFQLENNTHPELADAQTLQALVLTEQLGTLADARALWELIDEPTVFFVGRADDLSFTDYLPLLREAYGQGGLARFGDAVKLRAFRTRAGKALPKPRIETYVWGESAGKDSVQARQFRFMGQRYIPDSRILQELCHPKVEKRYFPKALDIPAVLGSDRAAQILDVIEKQPAYQRYSSQREKMLAEFAGLSPADWRQNLYHGWLWSLKPLLTVRPEGWPAFMRSTAWRDKSLITTLGSWTELRRDTMLYGKQSTAEAGDAWPAPPPGYVEPEPLVYARLAWLISATQDGLLKRGLLNRGMDDSFGEFLRLLECLERVSRKELANEPLTGDDCYLASGLGGQLEQIMTQAAALMEGVERVTWWDYTSAADRRMALVADVHNSREWVLEEAVGDPAEIWVVVPLQGRLVAARGAMFTWYEFVHSADDRLTDEAWQKKLHSGAEPDMSSWASKVIRSPGLSEPRFDRWRVRRHG